MSNLTERLNQILPRITSNELLNNEGIGNEIGFYIFDYDPKDELKVREHIDFITSHIEKKHANLKVEYIDLFKTIIDYLQDLKLLDKVLELQKKKGNSELLKAIRPVLDASKIANHLLDKYELQSKDLVIMIGVGAAYPLIRSHMLLNNLQKIMGSTPLVMFYPGKYTGNDLHLFGKLKDSNYYRAFRLI